MALGDISLTFCSTEISYPELKRFEQSELPDFFAEINKWLTFDQFKRADVEGAIFDHEGVRRMLVSRDGAEMEEVIDAGFDPARKNVVEGLEQVLKRFEINLFRVEEHNLRLRWPSPDVDNLGDLITEKAISLDDANFQHLGVVEGTPLNLFGTQEDPYLHWHLSVGAPHKTPNVLSVRLETGPFFPTDEITDIDATLQLTHKFMNENVVNFVLSFLG